MAFWFLIGVVVLSLFVLVYTLTPEPRQPQELGCPVDIDSFYEDEERDPLTP